MNGIELAIVAAVLALLRAEERGHSHNRRLVKLEFTRGTR
jgi:hypothetical protein